MDDKLREQLEEILKESEGEERTVTLMKRALEVDIPPEDAWLRDLFKSAATFLEAAYGSKREASAALPWLIFSLGVAYERGDRA